ncbi:MAG: rsbT, partial [Mycobacterium sp.]|nr:rsbT [Mycobacterium sp.]
MGSVQQVTADELQSLGQVVRRVARARGADPSTADDIAQETLTRLLSAGDRLEPEARMPWAITTAGNLLVTLHREADRARRHRYRLLDFTATARPENDVIALEEAAAVRSALSELDDSDRRLLVDHLKGVSTIDLAAASETSPGAVAARLNRTRARMRLDYLLALRRVELRTVACRRVLLAVSAADQRRQHALGASEHLAQCPTCADLVAPLSERKSRLAGIAIVPLVAMGGWGGRISRVAQKGTVQAAAAVTAVAVTAGAFALAGGDSQTAAKPAPPLPAQRSIQVQPAPLRTASGTDLLALQPAQLRELSGQQVIGEAIAAQSVVSYPGFWVGTARHRIYVHLVDPGLVRNPVRAGEQLSFTGVIEQNPKGFAVTDGVSVGEGS